MNKKIRSGTRYAYYHSFIQIMFPSVIAAIPYFKLKLNNCLQNTNTINHGISYHISIKMN